MTFTITSVGIAAVAAFGALFAGLVSYLALHRSSKPQILVYYALNPDVSSMIDLVIENIGEGSANEVKFSVDIPVNCFGWDSLDWNGSHVPKSGFARLVPGQRYVFAGGQYFGIKLKLKEGLQVRVSYQYKNPIGCINEESEMFILSVNHLAGMTTKTSVNQTIIDALTSHTNKTTIHSIRDELKGINSALTEIAKQNTKE